MGFFILGCSSDRSMELSGLWEASNYVKYPFDTICYESDFGSAMEKVTIKTDSGIMVISQINDSIIDIGPTTKTEIFQFHFDDETHGKLFMYEIDTARNSTLEDFRYNATEYNFSTLSNNGRTFLIVEYHFEQNERFLDTIEYQLISANELLISKDSLTRIKKP